MPRTTTLDCSGCPPLRALSFDVLGLIKGQLGGTSFSLLIEVFYAFIYFSFNFGSIFL